MWHRGRDSKKRAVRFDVDQLHALKIAILVRLDQASLYFREDPIYINININKIIL